MSQICKKCGTVAEDGQEYCSNCYAELGALKKKKAEKHRAELRNMGKKALAFSVIAAVAGIVMMFYLINMEKFSSIYYARCRLVGAYWHFRVLRSKIFRKDVKSPFDYDIFTQRRSIRGAPSHIYSYQKIKLFSICGGMLSCR